MTGVVVDTNVLIDIVSGAPPWATWSKERLAELARGSRLVINSIIFAEVSVGFSYVEEVEAVLPPTIFAQEAIINEMAFLAGKVFAAYRRRGGLRRSPLPDFFIGAHAAVAGHRLLTRDPVRYRTYFPKLEIIAPG